jgi:hypothetical protein
MPFDVKRGVELPETDDPSTPRTVRAIALAGLPPLTGADTDAANDIRATKLIEADALLSDMRGSEAITEEHPAGAIPMPPVTHAQVQQMQAALNRLRHQTEAEWWISHQHDTSQALLDLFMNAAQGEASANANPTGGASTY